MDSILKLMPEILRLAEYQEEVCEKAVYATWNILVGQLVRRNCQPYRLFKKRLFIAARDATWRRQLERMSGQILFKLNSTMGGSYVTHLEFRVNPALLVENGKQVESLIEEVDERAAPNSEAIKDEALRLAYMKAAARCLNRQADQE